MGPVVLALAERVPGGLELLLPGLVLRDEPPEWREVDDDAVVEVRVPERCDALHFIEEGAQLFDERLLRGELLALGGSCAAAQLRGERLEAPLLMSELGRAVVVLDAEPRAFAEGVHVEPNRIARRGRRELPG